jgi:hypothetical protein
MAFLPKFNRAQIPTMAGRNTSTSHVLGESSRAGKFSMMPGTNLKLFGGNKAKKDLRMNSGSAPHKSDFPNLNISFGQTGVTGRS